MADILVVGSINMDLVAFSDRLPGPGETLLGKAFHTFPGGKGANQAVAAARAGGRVAMLGRIGRDAFGQQLRAGLEENGVDTHFLDESDNPSGVAVVLSGGGNNMIVVAPGANAGLDAGAVAQDAFSGIRFVLAQLEIPLDGAMAAARLARIHNATFILDPAPARTLPPDLLALVDWLTPNESEACSLLGVSALGDPFAAARKLKALGPRCVIIKLGGDGAVLLCDDDVPMEIAARKVAVADTTAAGDAFNGAFAVALSEGRSAPDAARFAMTAAAISVTRPGAQASMARRAEIDAFTD